MRYCFFFKSLRVPLLAGAAPAADCGGERRQGLCIPRPGPGLLVWSLLRVPDEIFKGSIRGFNIINRGSIGLL